MHEIQLRQGRLRYRDVGSGQPLVFVHGLLVNGELWRKVVPPLSVRYRCLVPDLPFGSHRLAMQAGADLSPPGLARIVAELFERLDLQRVTLVGNDTGGAICQLVVADYGERVERLVLTPCDAFDNFPPKEFRSLLWAARVPGVVSLLMQAMRLEFLRQGPLGFGLLTKRPIDASLTRSYVDPALSSAGVRRDLRKVLLGISPRYTVEVSTRLARFSGPVMLVWPPDERLFPFAHARRLAGTFPNAEIVELADSGAFVPEDQPERLAECIARFAAAELQAPAGRRAS